MTTTWHQGLTTGVDEIDDDHVRLFQACAEVRLAAAGGGTRRRPPAVDAAVEALRAAAQYHFLREETLMEDHGFPGLDDHRRQHGDFIALLDRLAAADPKTDPATLDEASLAALEHWLVEHIEGGDSDYVAFFKMRGGG